MTWMQRLKRVFNIDIETYERSAGQVKIIVEASNRCIEDPAVIERILAHLKGKEPSSELAMLPEGRAPPQARLGAPGFSTDSMDTLSSALLLPFRKQRAYYWLEGRKQGKAGRGAKNQRLNGLDFVGKGASDGGPVDVGCDEGVFNSSYTRHPIFDLIHFILLIGIGILINTVGC